MFSPFVTHLFLCPAVCPGFCPVPSVFFSLHKNTERISMKLAGGNHCHQKIKRLYFVRNSNRNKITVYDREFESTSIGVLPRFQTGADD